MMFPATHYTNAVCATNKTRSVGALRVFCFLHWILRHDPRRVGDRAVDFSRSHEGRYPTSCRPYGGM